MKRGRRPKPTHLKLVEGNPGNRPLNEREPQPRRDEPPCPTWLDKEAKAEWKRQAPELYAIGVLTVVDGSVLAAYCEAFSLWKRASVRLQKQARNDDKCLAEGILVTTKSGNVILNPLQGACNVARRDMVRLAAELGLTPSSRANLEAGNRGGKEDPEYNF
jgi:P27 family predicted phage terminase small subunit